MVASCDKGKFKRSQGRIPAFRFFGRRGVGVFCVGGWRARPRLRAGFDGGGRARECGPGRNDEGKGMDAWRLFKLFSPVKVGTRAKDVADTR